MSNPYNKSYGEAYASKILSNMKERGTMKSNHFPEQHNVKTDHNLTGFLLLIGLGIGISIPLAYKFFISL